MFIILPVGVDYRARRYPVVTFTLMGLCVAIYLVTLICKLSGDSQAVDEWVYEHLWLIPEDSHWWTYLTHMFVHGGFFHVTGNMIYLYLFGSCVEDAIGRVRYVIFYLLCGVASAFAYILVSPDHFASGIPMGGASGAISGCIGGFLMLMAKTKIEFKWFIFFMFRFWNGEFMLPAWLVISFWFLGDVAGMVLSNLSNLPHHGGVAFGAHVGGTLFGLGLMAFERVRLKRTGFFDEEAETVVIAPIVRPAARPVQAIARSPIPLTGSRGLSLAPAPAPTTAASPAGETPVISLFWNETHYGPFTPSQIQAMFAQGAIPAEALYWQEGMEEWRTAEELREPGMG
jgi:membrane associated rhomboid family serine protease